MSEEEVERPRRKKVVVALAVAAVVALVAGFTLMGGSSDKADDSELIVFAPVERRTLRSVVTVRGEINREKQSDLYVTSSGMIDRVEVEEGTVVGEGERVFSLNGRPGISVNANSPFSRPLDVGSTGLDVLQLEMILAEDGFNPGTVDLLFTNATRKALGDWQHENGFPNTGPEPIESLNVSLITNPSGYQVGARNSAAVKINSAARPPAEGTLDELDESSSEEADGVEPAGHSGGSSDGSTIRNAVWQPVGSERLGTPTLNIVAAPATVSEGGTGSFIITATETATTDITIGLMAGGTATPGSDFVFLPGAITLEQGDSQVSVPMTSLTDSFIELDEIVTLSLMPGAGYLVGSPSAATMTITSPDNPEIEVAVVQEEIREGQTGTFRFTASNPVLEDTTVNFVIAGVAGEGSDYDEVDGSVKFLKGTTQVDLPVFTLVDDVIEPDESLTLQLQPVFGTAAYTLGGETSATLTILGDTEMPILTMEATPKIVVEGQGAQFVITANRPSNDPVEINYQVYGTATPKSDYVELDGTVTLPTGFTQAAVTIQTEPDRDVEGDETVSVIIMPGDDYTYEAPFGDTVTIESMDLPELTISGGGEVTEGGSAVFRITADQPMREDTSVNFSVNGTATPGVDYESPTGLVIMPRGSRSASISIPIFDDGAVFQPSDMVVSEWPARVGKVAVSSGQLVTDGTPIMEFVDDEFSINVTVNALDRPKLEAGLPVTIELAATGQTSSGSLISLDESATLQDNTEVYKGEVEAEEDLTAINGAQVNVDVIIAESTDAIVVPVASLLLDGQGNPQVRVVDPDTGLIVRVNVVTGLTEGSYVEVVEGLKGDERVVVQVEDPGTEDSGVSIEGDSDSGGASGDSGSGGDEGGGGSTPDEGGGSSGDDSGAADGDGGTPADSDGGDA